MLRILYLFDIYVQETSDWHMIDLQHCQLNQAIKVGPLKLKTEQNVLDVSQRLQCVVFGVGNVFV